MSRLTCDGKRSSWRQPRNVNLLLSAGVDSRSIVENLNVRLMNLGQKKDSVDVGATTGDTIPGNGSTTAVIAFSCDAGLSPA